MLNLVVAIKSALFKDTSGEAVKVIQLQFLQQVNLKIAIYHLIFLHFLLEIYNRLMVTKVNSRVGYILLQPNFICFYGIFKFQKPKFCTPWLLSTTVNTLSFNHVLQDWVNDIHVICCISGLRSNKRPCKSELLLFIPIYFIVLVTL